MLTVKDVLPDIQAVMGGVDRATALARLQDSVEILATEAEWDPLRGYLDVIVSNGCVTLPRQVGAVLAVNMGGRPTQGHDFWFRFHLNGPGDDCGSRCDYSWVDDLTVAVFRDPPVSGAYLVTQLETAADAGVLVRVYGYDTSGNWIRSVEGGASVDGFLVPTQYSIPVTNPNAPLIQKITRVSIAPHHGIITLSQVNTDSTLTRLGQYFPNDTEPMYRRIKLGQNCVWARIAFRKAVDVLFNDSDLIPLHSRYSLILMAKALEKLDKDRVEEAEAYHNKAIQLLIKKQASVNVPGGPSIQIADQNLIASRYDRLEG